MPVLNTNTTGTLIAEQNYDAWGRERNTTDWTYTLTANKPSWLYRGYTGHEMLPEFGLINMNNRMYDPLLGRMLAVDNFVANPYSTQAYNRYSYVMNNPTGFIDPSGEEAVTVAIVVGMAIVGAYAGGTIANGGELNPGQWEKSWKTLGYVVGGGVLGAIGGYYVGTAIKGASTLNIVVSGGANGVGSAGVVWNSTDGFQSLQWTTSAGGSGSVDFSNATASSDPNENFSNSTPRGERSKNNIYTKRDNDVDWKTLTHEFFSGTGYEYSLFTDGHPMVEDVKGSYIMGLALSRYHLDGQKPMIHEDIPFGLIGTLMSHSMTEQFIGGARVTIIPLQGSTYYQVDNTTGQYSLLYHFGKDKPRVSGEVIPRGTTYQRYSWFD